jgi:uncharacterized membrane protein YdjX (TVP38/TMEM64 family)
LSARWRKLEALLIFAGSFLLAAFVVKERPAVEAHLATLGPLALPLAVLVFTIVASAPFSVTDALAIMNGVLFGPLWGSVVNGVGVVCAALAGYLIARRTAGLLEIEQRLEKLPGWVRRFRVGSPAFLLAVRIIPGLGGTLATNVAAAFRVPVFVHVWTMSLIAIPICTLLAIFGDRVAEFMSARVATPVHEYVEKHHPHVPHLPRHHGSPAPGAPPR